eukprot:Tbor_TRINITY_DN5609_c3_g2::TRINITY_DN5609_c3_g2_i1::g.9550::m.9550
MSKFINNTYKTLITNIPQISPVINNAYPDPNTILIAQSIGKLLHLSEIKTNNLEKLLCKIRQVSRDTFYFLLDFPFTIMRNNNSYGHLINYTKQMRRNKKINPEDFKDVDTNELALLLSQYKRIRGPILSFDFRWFNYMYLLFTIYIIYRIYMIKGSLMGVLDTSVGSDLGDREGMFDDDYYEDEEDN